MNTKILVVDDEADFAKLIRQGFRKSIRDGVYDFVFALDGFIALDIIQQQPDIRIVITDIRMPKLNGLDLLSKISEIAPWIKVIIVSAHDDMQNIRTAMNRGAFDFICKPTNIKDLDITISKTIDQITIIDQKIKAARENDIFRMYIDYSIVDFIAFNDSVETVFKHQLIDATAMFINIGGFNFDIESLDRSVQIYSKFFEVIFDKILEQNGFIIQFIGNSLLVIFEGDYHLDRAADSALLVLKEVKLFCESEINLINNNLYVSVGISNGKIAKVNVGSKLFNKYKFTVFGNAIHIAKKLSQIAYEYLYKSSDLYGEVLIIEDSYNYLNGSFKCDLVNDFLFDKNEKMRVYRIVE